MDVSSFAVDVEQLQEKSVTLASFGPTSLGSKTRDSKHQDPKCVAVLDCIPYDVTTRS